MDKAVGKKGGDARKNPRKLDYEDFASILNLADTDVEKAIEFWLEAIPTSVALDAEYIQSKTGQLKKLRDHFSYLQRLDSQSYPEPQILDEEQIEDLLGEAESRLQQAAHLEDAAEDIINDFFDGASEFESDEDTELDASDDLILLDEEGFIDNDTRDLRRLEQVYADRSSADLYAWARRGYDHLLNETLSPIRAYAPLRLYRSFSISEQLASAYRLAKTIGLNWADKLLIGCLDYLNIAPVSQTEELEYQRSLWHMMALTQPSSTIIPTARNYVLRLSKSNSTDEEALSAALNAVLQAVGRATPATNASSAFFEFVHRRYSLNDHNMIAFVRCWIAEQETAIIGGVPKEDVRRAWSMFVHTYSSNLKRIETQPLFEGVLRDVSQVLALSSSPSAGIETMISVVLHQENSEVVIAETNELKDELLDTPSIEKVRQLVGLEEA